MKSTRSSDMAVSLPWASRAWTGRKPRSHRPRWRWRRTHDTGSGQNGHVVRPGRLPGSYNAERLMHLRRDGYGIGPVPYEDSGAGRGERSADGSVLPTDQPVEWSLRHRDGTGVGKRREHGAVVKEPRRYGPGSAARSRTSSLSCRDESSSVNLFDLWVIGRGVTDSCFRRASPAFADPHKDDRCRLISRQCLQTPCGERTQRRAQGNPQICL
jgi:hypothetical protein